MTKTAKVVNYTDEQTATLASLFTADAPAQLADAKALAEKMGKNARSLVAKLSRMGIYKAQEPVSKTGEPVVKKDEHADAIGAILLLTEAETSSLTKATKTALVKIFNALATSKPIEPGDGNGE